MNSETPSDTGANSNELKSPRAKRRKDNKERSRVSRACDRCKKRKIRCNGKCPCPLCLRAGLPCEFTASYTRGRLPYVFVDEAAMPSLSQPRIVGPIQMSSSEASPKDTPLPAFQFSSPIYLDRSAPVDVYSEVNRLAVPNEGATRHPLARSSPEPTQTDQQGHYIGPSSGVSFLLRIQKKLHENSSWSHNSSIFTFGDAPLPGFDPTFFVLPPKADAQRLVERYFDFAAPTHRFLHRPTIERLLHEFYETQGDMRSKEDSASNTALLLIVFAQGQVYMPAEMTAEDNSARYYFAAEHQLTKERGSVRLASVQARLVQCYYLLAQSRINQCWSLFGTTAHLALAIGLNRGRPVEACSTIDYVELESRRRLFWCAYVLDNFLASALGRPRTFHDEDIDQELPTIVNDDDLQSNSIKTSSSQQSIMLAPVAHIKLSRIVSCVLRDLYPIRPPSISLRLELATKYTKALRDWRTKLARFLDAEGVDSSSLIPIYQRQRNVLNLAFFHTMLLIHRPFLLSNFASLSNIDAQTGRKSNIDTSPNITECLEAAMGIVRIVDEVSQGSQIFRAFWFTQYYAFCAVVVLYIYRIQQHDHLVDHDKGDIYFNAGQRCQAKLSNLSDTDCLSKRYCLVLEELRIEAAPQNNKQLATLPNTASSNGTSNMNSLSSIITSEASPANNTYPSAFYPDSTIPPTPGPSTTPENAENNEFANTWMGNSNFMAEMTSWGQFDSLVTAGVGALDGGGGLQADGRLGYWFNQ